MMSSIPAAATIDEAPAASRPMLDTVNKQFGSVPNMHRLVANSPAALKGYLGSGSRQPRYNSLNHRHIRNTLRGRMLGPGSIPARVAALRRYRFLRISAAAIL